MAPTTENATSLNVFKNIYYLPQYGFKNDPWVIISPDSGLKSTEFSPSAFNRNNLSENENVENSRKYNLYMVHSFVLSDPQVSLKNLNDANLDFEFMKVMLNLLRNLFHEIDFVTLCVFEKSENRGRHLHVLLFKTNVWCNKELVELRNYFSQFKNILFTDQKIKSVGSFLNYLKKKSDCSTEQRRKFIGYVFEFRENTYIS